MDPLSAEVWKSIGVAIVAQPLVTLPAMAIAAAVAYWFKGVLDDSEVRGLRTNNEALEFQLSTAREKGGVARDEIKSLKTKLEQIERRVALIDRPELEKLVKETIRAVQEVATTNTAKQVILDAEPADFRVNYFKLLKLAPDHIRPFQNWSGKRTSKDLDG